MRLLELAPSEAAGSLQMLSGAKAILFCVRSNIEVLTLADRRRRTVLQNATFAHYLPGGFFVYLTGGSMLAVPLDLKTLKTLGSPAPWRRTWSGLPPELQMRPGKSRLWRSRHSG